MTTSQNLVRIFLCARTSTRCSTNIQSTQWRASRANGLMQHHFRTGQSRERNDDKSERETKTKHRQSARVHNISTRNPSFDLCFVDLSISIILISNDSAWVYLGDTCLETCTGRWAACLRGCCAIIKFVHDYMACLLKGHKCTSVFYGCLWPARCCCLTHKNRRIWLVLVPRHVLWTMMRIECDFYPDHIYKQHWKMFWNLIKIEEIFLTSWSPNA